MYNLHINSLLNKITTYYKYLNIHNNRNFILTIIVFILIFLNQENLFSESDKQITLPFPSENLINKVEKEIEIEVIQLLQKKRKRKKQRILT